MINFGLYGSNWTEMDLKFKKTLLLIMSMNSAHRRMMKVSPKSVVNMEMFARVTYIFYTYTHVVFTGGRVYKISRKYFGNVFINTRARGRLKISKNR